MMAAAVLVLSTCVTLGLGVEPQVNVTLTNGQPWDEEGLINQGNIFVNTTRRPRDCEDLLREGNVYEGHYVVYPQLSAPNKASLIHCSYAEGMTPLSSSMANKELAKNCLELQQQGANSGINIIYPYLDNPADPVLVLCDMETDGGGWTVFQNRYDGSENFYRNWADYIEGFGNANEEHYLGNELLSSLTKQCVNELWVELEDWEGLSKYAHYQSFYVDARHNYRLQAVIYDGTAGDSLEYHNTQQFTTFDSDNDPQDGYNCAEFEHGAWWYNDCADANLNGRYYPSSDTGDDGGGMRWNTFHNWHYSLKKAKMMTRPYPGAGA